MPTLKQITCHVEWSDSDLPLHEYQTIYADGFVETFVAVPPVSSAFSIHLRSHGYVAPGLAMFVYMDGEYQCNRNRSNLKIPSEARSWKQIEVDFKVRQKEEIMPDGSFSGKQWKFESLKTAKRFAPHDAQHFGTIEVVVLRCYPTQPSKDLASSRFVAEPLPLAHPRESTSPLATDTDTSSSSSPDNESSSSESEASVIPAMFDGTADYAGRSSVCYSFGDMVLDQQSSNHGKSQPRRSFYNEPNLPNLDARQSGDTSGAPIRYDQLDGSSDPKNWENWVVPESNWENQVAPNSNWESQVVPDSNWENRVVPDLNWPNHDNTKNQNQPSGSVRHSNNEPSTSHSGSHNRVSRSSPRTKAQRNSSGNESNDRYSTSNRSKNTPTGNTANQTSPTSVWTQPQQPPAQAAPAVVINVSHGTPRPASFSSSASNQAVNTESANAKGWQNPTQPDKIDEYLADTNQSPEGSHQSRASTKSNNSQVWPVQDYNQTNDNGIQADIAHQWHNPLSHEEANESQWRVVEDIRDTNRDHEVSNNKNDNYPWDNNIIGSRPLESSTTGAQNNSNERSSNVNNNTSYHIGKNASIENKQAPYVNPSASMHPIPQGQLSQQPSSSSSFNPTFPNHTWRNDAPKSQHSGIKANEATQHISPQAWTQNAAEPNNRASELPPQAASHIYGPNFPTFIDPRPRPHWYNWKKPQRSSSAFKAENPSVEPAEPLNYVPSEVAQRNKMSHQVYLSQPAEYVHKRASPRYMDDFSSPYAVFIFKYRSKAILEQILNTTLIEPEAQEKERLQDLSKDELIEQILKAKMYKDNSLSGSVSSHTAKTEKPTYIRSDAAAAAAADERRLASQRLPQPPNKAVQSSDKASTNPEHHWGRRTPILNTASPHPEAKVASWLGSGGGGGHASGSRGGSQNYGPFKNGSAQNDNRGSGSGNQGTQNNVVGDWNKFGTAGAWAANDAQHTVMQTAGEVHGENGGGEGQPGVQW